MWATFPILAPSLSDHQLNFFFMNLRFNHFIVLLLLSFAHQLQAQLVVNNTLTVEEYVSQVLLGNGVVATNITYNGVPANQVSVQVGSFNSINSNIGLSNGVIIAAGEITTALGPNDAGGNGTFSGSTYADADLSSLTTFGLNDVAVIEFDFVPSGDTIQFRYVFASEEYPEYACSSFNDVFGFFISGPGFNGPFSDQGVNLALIPGTETYVAINTVTPGVAGSNGNPDNCESIDPDWESYSQYYTSNTLTNGTEVQFDGFTVPLVATAAVECGQTYHIKFAVADATDTSFDSAVFLESNSFSSNAYSFSGNIETDTPPINIPENTIIEGCYNGFFSVFQPDESIADTLVFTISGSAIEGVDYEALPDTVFIPEGEELVNIALTVIPDNLVEAQENIIISFSFFNDCGDEIITSAELFIQDYVEPTLSVSDVCIPGTGTISVTPTTNNGVQPFTFDWNGPNAGTNAVLVLQDGDGGDYTLSITDLCGTSISDAFTALESDPFTLTAEVDDPNNLVPAGTFIEGCIEGRFVLSQNDPDNQDVVVYQVSGSATSGTDYTGLSGSVTLPAGQTEVDLPISTIVDNVAEGNETITITYNYVDGCGENLSTSASVVILDYTTITADVVDVTNVCPGAIEVVNPAVSNGVAPYVFDWSTGESTSSIAVSEGSAGDYSLEITDACDQSVSLTYSITEPTDLLISEPFELCLGDVSDVIVAGGSPPYLFDYDTLTVTVNANNQVFAVAQGLTDIEVTDACGVVLTTSVLTYGCDTRIPNIITPNGDGLNDFFVVEGIEFFPNSKMNIFDRWGALVLEDADYKNNWNGSDRPDGVYYYILNRSDGENIEGYLHLLSN